MEGCVAADVREEDREGREGCDGGEVHGELKG